MGKAGLLAILLGGLLGFGGLSTTYIVQSKVAEVKWSYHWGRRRIRGLHARSHCSFAFLSSSQ
jgi:hypothetical protein